VFRNIIVVVVKNVFLFRNILKYIFFKIFFILSYQNNLKIYIKNLNKKLKNTILTVFSSTDVMPPLPSLFCRKKSEREVAPVS